MSNPKFNEIIDPAKVSINLPLFQEFFALVQTIHTQFPDIVGYPSNHASPIDVMPGFMIHSPNQLIHGGYSCTPLNTLEFASTGMDGEHFSFLVQDFEINHKSPIIYTAPITYDTTPNVILAPNFRIFMQLGIRYGFFALGDLASQPEEAIAKFESESWQPPMDKETTDANTEQMRVLEFIAEALQLEPYQYPPGEFDTLQERYGPQLILSQEYSELGD